MNEILPGLHHWRVVWPGIWSLESYFLQTEAGSVIVDPIESTGLDLIDATTDIQAVIVTVGWHERSRRLFGKRTRTPVFVPELDLCMLEDLDSRKVYRDGDILPGELRAIGAPGLTRGENVLLSGTNGGTLFVGDCLGTTAKWAPDGMPIGGHPTGHPIPKDTLSHLLDLDFVNLCPGHGDPILGNGKQKLNELFQSGKSTSTGPQSVTYFPLHDV